MKNKIINIILLLSVSTYSFGQLENKKPNDKYNKYIQNNAPHKGISSPNSISRDQDKSEHNYLLKPYILEFSGGFFSPTACVLKNIYGSIWGAFQFKFSASVARNHEIWRRLYVFAALNYATKKGCSLNGGQRTRINLIPLSFGLRFIQPTSFVSNCTSVYAGLGVQANIARTRNDSNFVDRRANKSGVGGIAEFGFYFNPCQWGLVSLGLDYTFARLGCYKPCTENVVGFKLKTSGIGFRIGAGVTF